jgi:hypothetical protein
MDGLPWVCRHHGLSGMQFTANRYTISGSAAQRSVSHRLTFFAREIDDIWQRAFPENRRHADNYIKKHQK